MINHARPTNTKYIVDEYKQCFTAAISRLTGYKKISQRPKRCHEGQHGTALGFWLKFSKVGPDDRSAAS
jgi:hypothetical protein